MLVTVEVPKDERERDENPFATVYITAEMVSALFGSSVMLASILIK
jgi:hypothetical protein